MDQALIEKIIEPRSEKEQKAQRNRVIAGFWTTFKKASKRIGKKAGRNIPFMHDLVAAYYCAFDPTTPKKAQAILIAALAYFVMPFDIVPDFFALIGFSDDIAVLTFAIATIRTYMKEEHYKAAAKALSDQEFNKKS